MNLSRYQRAWKRRIWIPVRSRVAPEVVTQVRGQQMRIDLRDYPIGQTLYLDGNYEQELQQLMPHLNLSGSVCLDVGANIGLHTLTMSELVGAAGQVFAFEPEKHNFQLLEQNLRRNGITNVVLQQSAVSDKEGICQIGLSPVNYGDHRVSTAAPANWRTQEVQMTTVDASVGHLPDRAIRFIKIDVQGHELHVLGGMRQTLERNRDAIVVIEVAPDLLAHAGTSATELMSLLAAWGFTGWELLEHRIIPVSPPWVYDLIRDQRWVDVVLSRNSDLLNTVMSNYCGVELPLASGCERMA
jgi:FkbM family methyltransferase